MEFRGTGWALSQFVSHTSCHRGGGGSKRTTRTGDRCHPHHLSVCLNQIRPVPLRWCVRSPPRASEVREPAARFLVLTQRLWYLSRLAWDWHQVVGVGGNRGLEISQCRVATTFIGSFHNRLLSFSQLKLRLLAPLNCFSCFHCYFRGWRHNKEFLFKVRVRGKPKSCRSGFMDRSPSFSPQVKELWSFWNRRSETDFMWLEFTRFNELKQIGDQRGELL